MKEQQPISLEQLKERQDHLSKIHGERKELLGRLTHLEKGSPERLEEPQRCSAVLSNAKIERSILQVKKSIVRREDALLETMVEIEKYAPPKTEKLSLPNGREIEVDTKERLLLEGIQCGTPDSAITYDELVEVVLSKELNNGKPIEEARKDLGKYMGSVRKKLKEAEIKVRKGKNSNGKSGYYLEPINDKRTQTVDVKERGQVTQHIEQTEKTRKNGCIEKWEEKAREAISHYLDLIDQKRVEFPLRFGQLYFQFKDHKSIKSTWLDRMIESGHVSHQISHDSHPMFNKVQTVKILFLRDHLRKNHFDSHKSERIDDLIQEEVAEREEERRKAEQEAQKNNGRQNGRNGNASR